MEQVIGFSCAIYPEGRLFCMQTSAAILEHSVDIDIASGPTLIDELVLASLHSQVRARQQFRQQHTAPCPGCPMRTACEQAQ